MLLKFQQFVKRSESTSKVTMSTINISMKINPYRIINELFTIKHKIANINDMTFKVQSAKVSPCILTSKSQTMSKFVQNKQINWSENK